MRWNVAVLVGLFAVACNAGAPPPPPYKPIADNKLLMNAVIDPAADGIWDKAGSVITAAGVEDLSPKTEEEWMAVRNAAVTLAEAGNLLMLAPRAQDGEEWMRLSQALTDTSAKAIRAAEAHDAQGVFDIGGEIYAVCTNCHSKYMPSITRFATE